MTKAGATVKNFMMITRDDVQTIKLEWETGERTKKTGGVSALQAQVTGTLSWVKGRVHCAEEQHSS